MWKQGYTILSSLISSLAKEVASAMLVFALKENQNFNGSPMRSERKSEGWLLQENVEEHRE